MTEWLEEGKALGARDSINGWEIGRWIVRGEEHFFPVPSRKKERNAHFRNFRNNWTVFIRQAEEVTNLKEKTLRQYARVVRNDFRVEGLSLAHHIEALRARKMVNSKRGEKLGFDRAGAIEILNFALKNKWSAVKTRAEAVRRYPIPKTVETDLNKAEKALRKILKTIDSNIDQIAFLDGIREQLSLESDAAVLRFLNEGNEPEPDISYTDCPY
jgi:hypothetical protein